MSLFLGIDTSNYTTSIALCDECGRVLQKKRLLPVKNGERGLRQSDAVFHHTKAYPELLEKLKDCGIEQDIGYVVSYLTSEFETAMKYIEEGKITNLLIVAKKIVDKDLKGKDSYVEYYRNRLLFIDEKEKKYHRFFLDILILIYQELLKKENGKYFSDIIKDLNNNITTEEIIRKLELLNIYQERFNYHINLDLQYTSLFSKL